MPDDDRAAQISARVAAATPGPWCVVDDQDWEEVKVIRGSVNRRATPGICTPICTTDQDGTEDADLIANAPADLAFLLAERDELLRRVEQAEARTQEREQKAYETGQRDGAAADRHGRKEEVEQAERAGAVKALRSVGMSDQADLIEMGRFTIAGQPIVADLYDRTGQETKGVRQ